METSHGKSRCYTLKLFAETYVQRCCKTSFSGRSSITARTSFGNVVAGKCFVLEKNETKDVGSQECLHKKKRGRLHSVAWFLYRGYIHRRLHNNGLFEEWASAQAQRNTHCDVITSSMVKESNLPLEQSSE